MKLRDKRTGIISKVDGSYADRVKGTVRIYLADLNKKPVGDVMLPDIMDNYEVVEQPKTIYDLKDGDECWALYVKSDSNGGIVPKKVHWHEYEWQDARRMGLIYLTKKDAEKEIARTLAEQILLRDTKGFNPNPNDADEWKYYIDYSMAAQELIVVIEVNHLSHDIYFATEEDAEASIDAHPNEWRTYLGVEE